MPLPLAYQSRFIYQFVHLDNLEGILKNGVLSKTRLSQMEIEPYSIADPNIQAARSKMPVTCGPKGVVHDYVPFYLCKRSKMLLAVVNKKNVDQEFLVYLATPLSVVLRENVVFTDAAANRGSDPPNFYSSHEDLEKLDWDSINSQSWSLGDEGDHKKMAEVLVHSQLAVADIAHIIVWNASFGKEVKRLFKEYNLEPPKVVEDSHFYFTRYPQDVTRSLVTGPYFANREYGQTVKRILKNGPATNGNFSNLDALRKALRDDITCIKETNELVGLETEAGFHGDLGEHTKKVVENLRKSKEFQSLEKTDKILVEIAAYLHDVGKGPKSRWANNGGRYKNDANHALAALPMVERVLTEEVGGWKKRSARVICKLVGYHDLIGEIVGKDRDREQLFEIIKDERELNMLIALTKADTLAVHPEWWNELRVGMLKKQAIQEFNNATGEDKD